MDNRSLHLTLFSFLFLLFFCLATSTTVTTTSSHVTLNPLQGVFCSVIDCGQGTCQASNNSLLGFDCLCKPGWKKIQIGPFTFPSCLVPNCQFPLLSLSKIKASLCTVDFDCVKGSPPPPSLPPPPNQTNSPTQGIKEGDLLLSDCDLVWCGDGECVSNGTGYICQCHQGSENLFNSSGLACFKPCYFGADCQGLGLNFPSGNPPPPPPSSNSPTSYGNGLKGVSSCSGTLSALTVIVVIAACQT
ncbi:Teneurin-4 [Gossypium australe]|uniref:Teneurin-4 n=1 Tax=Gossypium australe TaxID=47621 RepID=A0A5B6X6Y7_9ROSI|nr:Teneurin-4 [Gossypium australe]